MEHYLIRQERLAYVVQTIEDDGTRRQLPPTTNLTEGEWGEWRGLRKWIRRQRREMRAWAAEPTHTLMYFGDLGTGYDLVTWQDRIYSEILQHLKPAAQVYKKYGPDILQNERVAGQDSYTLRGWSLVLDDAYTSAMAESVAEALETWFPDDINRDIRSAELIQELRPLLSKWQEDLIWEAFEEAQGDKGAKGAHG